MSRTKVTVLHALSKKIPWTDISGRVRTCRSYVHNRAAIMAITSGIETGGGTWGPKNWIRLQLHSSYTWRTTTPEALSASTELRLGRADAEFVIVALLNAIAEYDRLEEEGSA